MMAGTDMYMAPEMALGLSPLNARTADVWSVGVILYAMVCGQFPFAVKQDAGFQNYLLGHVEFPTDVEVSKTACWVLKCRPFWLHVVRLW